MLNYQRVPFWMLAVQMGSEDLTHPETAPSATTRHDATRPSNARAEVVVPPRRTRWLLRGSLEPVTWTQKNACRGKKTWNQWGVEYCFKHISWLWDMFFPNKMVGPGNCMLNPHSLPVISWAFQDKSSILKAWRFGSELPLRGCPSTAIEQPQTAGNHHLSLVFPEQVVYGLEGYCCGCQFFVKFLYQTPPKQST